MVTSRLGRGIRRTVFAAGLVLLVHLAAVQRLGAQSEVTISSPATTCPCGLEVTRLGSLGEPDGVGFVGSPMSLARDSRGRWYVVSPEIGPRIQVFGPQMSFLRSIGREGEGPGEFGGVTGVAVGPGDSLVVIDTGNLRLTVLDAEYEYARTISEPLTGTTARISPTNRIYVAGLYRKPGRMGFPVHRVDREGDVQSLATADPSEATPETRRRMRRVLAIAPRGIWVGHTLEYNLEFWNESDSLVKVVRREADWFPKAERYGLGEETHEPPSFLMGVHTVDENRVLTLTNIREVNWEEGIGSREVVTGGRAVGVTDPEAVWRTRLEVLDVISGRVVASLTVPERMLGFVGGGLPVAFGEGTAEGIFPIINLWRIDFEGTGR